MERLGRRGETASPADAVGVIAVQFARGGAAAAHGVVEVKFRMATLLMGGEGLLIGQACGLGRGLCNSELHPQTEFIFGSGAEFSP